MELMKGMMMMGKGTHHEVVVFFCSVLFCSCRFPLGFDGVVRNWKGTNTRITIGTRTYGTSERDSLWFRQKVFAGGEGNKSKGLVDNRFLMFFDHGIFFTCDVCIMRKGGQHGLF